MAASQLRYLDPKKVRFFLPEGSTHLRAIVEDELCILNAKLRRPFPLSNQDTYLSVQDGEGTEIGLLRSLSELDTESRRLVEIDLDRRYFTPKIVSIDSLKQEGGMWTFVVRTQRGPSQFYVRNWRDSSHEIQHGRWQINSVDGQRFEIEDYELLDEKSKNLLEQMF